MLLSWLMGPGTGAGACCARSPKGFSCFRGRDGEGEGNIVEYAPHARHSSMEFVVDDVLCRGAALPAGPMERTVPTFATGQEAGEYTALQGCPLYTADVLRLSLGDAIHESVMALYVNGFLITPRGGDGCVAASQQPICRLWSPFSLVEKCQVKSKQSESQWAIFKLTFFRKEGQDASFYFATAGMTAEAQRDVWVEEIIRAMSNLTLSLFPSFEISVEPVPGRVATSTRIMAGYLLQGGPTDSASLVFCELHAYASRESRLALYRDEWCEQEVLSIPICDSSIVSTRKGEYCTVFGINDHLFCTRTEDERELWLRAVSNIKVKLMFDAPDPTAEDLEIFRSAVHERIETLPPPLPPGGQEAVDAFVAAAWGSNVPVAGGRRAPVLAQVPRRPPCGPRGDTFEDPEPVVEEERCESRPLPSPAREPFPKILALEVSPPPAQVLSSCAEDNNSVFSCGTTSPAEESPEAIPPRGEPPAALSPSKPAAAAAVPPAGAPSKARRPALMAVPVSMGTAVLSMDAVMGAEIEGL